MESHLLNLRLADISDKPHRYRSLKDSAVVIGRDFNQMNQLQSARFDGLDGLFRRQSQFRSWREAKPKARRAA